MPFAKINSAKEFLKNFNFTFFYKKLQFKKLFLRNWFKRCFVSIKIISNVWKAALITEAISTGSHGLESLDPFQAVDPLVDNGRSTFETNVKVADNDIDFFVTPKSF